MRLMLVDSIAGMDEETWDASTLPARTVRWGPVMTFLGVV